MDSDQEQQQKIQSVVIITLPPLDDPSQGKTITAFTLTDQNHHNHPEEEERNPQVESNLPPQNPQSQLSFPEFFMYHPGKLLGFLGISILVVFLYGSFFSDTLREFRVSYEEDDSDRKTTTFVFPLYHKLGAREIPVRDLEVRIGNSVEPIVQEMVKIPKVHRLVSMNAASVESSTIFPVAGNVYPDGLYYTYVLVGNPKRPYYLDIDTGSDLTWIQCDAPCSSCAKGANPLYKPKRGNLVPTTDSLCVEVQRNQKAKHCETCQQCDYEIEYADLSTSIGVLARDELHLTLPNGSLTKSNIVFGCAYDQQGLLLNTLSKTDGILGLSRAKASLPSQLASRGLIKNVVGHCLATDLNAGSYMFMGDDFVPQRGIEWVPMLNHPFLDSHHVELIKMNYGSNSLTLGGQNNRLGKIVFDTGSSYTYLTKDAYSELVATLEEVPKLGLTRDESDTTLPICWKTDFPIGSIDDVRGLFRTITLQFGSKWWIISRKLQIPPEGYLIISNKGNVCLGLLDGSSVHDGSSIILGDISLRGQLIVYDNANQRIGWMKSECVQPQEFQSFPFFEG